MWCVCVCVCVWEKDFFRETDASPRTTPKHMNTAAHAGSPTQLVMNPVAKQDDRKADEFAYDRPRTEEPNLCCPNIQVCSSLYLFLPLPLPLFCPSLSPPPQVQPPDARSPPPCRRRFSASPTASPACSRYTTWAAATSCRRTRPCSCSTGESESPPPQKHKSKNPSTLVALSHLF